MEEKNADLWWDVIHNIVKKDWEGLQEVLEE
jgi:hypothetical protein